MIELKPLYLCIDTSKAVPLISDAFNNIDLEELKMEGSLPENPSPETDKP